MAAISFGASKMKAISLWQPWATGIATGVNLIETRHWKTDYRGPLAIHAAKRWGADQREFAAELQEAGLLPNDIPLGAIVATCTLADCRPAEDVLDLLTDVNRMFGDYSAGRFAWFLEAVVMLQPPIPYRGAQGFFSVPDAILES
jgi:hypothetical protein